VSQSKVGGIPSQPLSYISQQSNNLFKKNPLSTARQQDVISSLKQPL